MDHHGGGSQLNNDSAAEGVLAMEPASIPLRVWHRALTHDQREFFNERAAIIEFDGKIPRADAEQQAAAQTAAHFNIPPPPPL